MLHFYFGPDDFRLHEEYGRLRDSLDGDALLETNTTLLPARGLRPQELIQHLAAIPFMAEARLVVVEGLLSSLGGGQPVLREWQPLLDVIAQLPPSNHLALLEHVPKREQGLTLGRSVLAKALRALENADVKEFRELRIYGRGGEASEVVEWVRARSRDRGVEIEQPAIQELVDLVGPNLWSLATELDKLSRYADGRSVSAADVRALTPESADAGIFNLVDAVVEGRGGPALLLLRRMLEQGTDSPSNVRTMIARQVRNLVRAKELLEQGADQRAVGEATGVRNAFPLGKLMRQARAISRPTAEAALREMERSDHAVKTGRVEEVLALELLLTRLAAMARSPSAVAGAAPG
jgi:DNA polymerase-3 subunit delta